MLHYCVQLIYLPACLPTPFFLGPEEKDNLDKCILLFTRGGDPPWKLVGCSPHPSGGVLWDGGRDMVGPLGGAEC